MKIDLRKTIDESGMSSYAFASLLGIHRNTVYLWLNGRSGISDLSVMRIKKACTDNDIQIFYKKEEIKTAEIVCNRSKKRY